MPGTPRSTGPQLLVKSIDKYPLTCHARVCPGIHAQIGETFQDQGDTHLHI